jgi:hypothetical protein
VRLEVWCHAQSVSQSVIHLLIQLVGQ